MLPHAAWVGLLETYRYLEWVARGRDANGIIFALLMNVEDL